MFIVLKGHSANFIHGDRSSHNKERHLVCEYRCKISSLLLEDFLKRLHANMLTITLLIC